MDYCYGTDYEERKFDETLIPKEKVVHSPELVIPYLQSQFYSVKRRELEVEKQELNRKLEHYAFDAKMDELTQKSLRLFRAELATRYHWRNNRRCFK